MDAKEIANLNLTTKLLSNFIFASDSFSLLLGSGLVSAYLDDYGYRCKYKNCMFFLFNTSNKYYSEMEENVTNFKAFHDWYDVTNQLRMLVFKVNHNYAKDLENFKNSKFDQFSNTALSVIPIRSFNFELDYSKEIYRYGLCEN